MLVLSTAAQTAACVFVFGVPYLVPELRSAEGLTLAQAGAVIAAPTVGMVLALVAWGAAADRYGERIVLSSGLGLATLALLGSLFVHGPVPLSLAFFLAGMAGASVYAASGRVVMGWFSARERGLAMGLRQTSTPLGTGIAALALPPLAEHTGLHGALLFATALTGVVALLVTIGITDPPRPAPPPGKERDRPDSPYRTPTLWRIHGASALLVWPQFTVSAFGLVFLVEVEHWSATRAGQLMALGQLLGALARVAVGVWSDRVGSRLRPMRQLAVANGALLALLAVCAQWPSAASEVLLVAACGLTASSNGLAFTSIAELAGPHWSGRALGIQNTSQNLTASVAAPVVGVLIGSLGFGAAFLLCAVTATSAVLATPAARSTRPTETGPDRAAPDSATGPHDRSRTGPSTGWDR